MALRILKDGVVETDSVDELLAYQKAVGTRMFRRAPAVGSEQEDTLPETAKRFVKVLLPATDGMDTLEVAKALDIKTAKGVGGFVTSLASWGKRHGLKKRQLVRKERRANGHGRFVRRIALADHFRKMIEKGQVPGVKLDT